MPDTHQVKLKAQMVEVSVYSQLTPSTEGTAGEKELMQSGGKKRGIKGGRREIEYSRSPQWPTPPSEFHCPISYLAINPWGASSYRP